MKPLSLRRFQDMLLSGHLELQLFSGTPLSIQCPREHGEPAAGAGVPASDLRFSSAERLL